MSLYKSTAHEISYNANVELLKGETGKSRKLFTLLKKHLDTLTASQRVKAQKDAVFGRREAQKHFRYGRRIQRNQRARWRPKARKCIAYLRAIGYEVTEL